jgi:AcrR family transcriptional regulator
VPKLTAIRQQALNEIVKQSLFQATVAVLSEHGVEGLTMDRVASAAGVAKGSLYHYFRGKRELLEFVLAKAVAPIFQDLEEIIASNLTAIAKLEEHLRLLLEHLARHAQVFRLLFHDDAAHRLIQSSDRCSRETACRRMSEFFRQGMAEGVFRAGDPLLFANMFLGLCRGVLDTYPELETPDQRQAVRRLILGTLLEGIAVKESPAAEPGEAR